MSDWCRHFPANRSSWAFRLLLGMFLDPKTGFCCWVSESLASWSSWRKFLHRSWQSHCSGETIRARNSSLWMRRTRFLRFCCHLNPKIAAFAYFRSRTFEWQWDRSHQPRTQASWEAFCRCFVADTRLFCFCEAQKLRWWCWLAIRDKRLLCLFFDLQCKCWLSRAS